MQSLHPTRWQNVLRLRAWQYVSIGSILVWLVHNKGPKPIRRSILGRSNCWPSCLTLIPGDCTVRVELIRIPLLVPQQLDLPSAAWLHCRPCCKAMHTSKLLTACISHECRWSMTAAYLPVMDNIPVPRCTPAMTKQCEAGTRSPAWQSTLNA